MSGIDLKVGVIGHGAIGSFLVERMMRERRITLTAVLARSVPRESPLPIVRTIGDLLKKSPHLVVECAGHEALREFGPAVIRAGTDLLPASTGALADPILETRLREAALKGRRLLIAGSALGGLDALHAAFEAGLQTVHYEGRKAPRAWKNTAAEELVDLSAITSATAFLKCDARTAALRFPQNANVVAGILAGLRFEGTRVHLAADPAAHGNHHSVVASGAFGEITMNVHSATMPSNPKTSVIAAFSLPQITKDYAGLTKKVFSLACASVLASFANADAFRSLNCA